jgi:hypothetical protein
MVSQSEVEPMMMPTSGFFVFEWAFAGIYRSSDLGAPIAACETDKFIARRSKLENALEGNFRSASVPSCLSD